MQLRLSMLSTVAALGAALLLAGCDRGKQADQASAATPPTPVTVVKVTTHAISPATTFTGRIQAKDKVDLLARVSGFLEKRLFTEGADVKDGDLLFVIEKPPYQATVDQAKAALETAQATLKLADIDVERQTQLVQRNVGAQAVLDQAVAKQGEARGNMLAQQAALEKAELDLGYTDIRTPLTGRIGRATVSVGNYVSPANGALATVVSQDPIYATFPVTQREVLAVRKAQAPRTHPDFTIHLQLADGSRYPLAGKVDFIDNTVNQGTDTVQVRAVFDNPDRILVDGQLVTVVVQPTKSEQALVIPQAALQIDQAGPFVLVVDKDNKIEVRRVETGVPQGPNIVINKGLAENDRVVTEGIQKVRPGQVVAPTEVQPGV
jgi:membrane fusion protein, multidrug efflux system